MNRRILAALLAAVCLLMSGCIPLSVNLQQETGTVSMPVPAGEETAPAVGDGAETHGRTVSLYYVEDDRHSLTSVQKEIEVSPGSAAEQAVLEALLQTPAPAGAFSPFPEGTKLLRIERSGSAAVVELSIEARNAESDEQLLWMRESIAAALAQLDGIEHTGMLIGGRDEGLAGLPSGAAAANGEDLAAAWARVNAQGLTAQENGAAAAMERTAILYYASRDGGYIVPVARSVQITADNMVMPLIEALCVPPGESDSLISPFPADAPVLAAAPELTETEDGRRMVKLTFDANLIASLEREGLSAWQLYASLTYTITGFVPEVDGLVVLIGDGQLSRTERAGEELTFEGGEMSRQSYPDAVGRLGEVYLPSDNGRLLRLERVLSQRDALQPRALLAGVFQGPAEWETGAARALPDGVTIDDVLGVRIAGGTAAVNLSSNLYRCCQSLTAQQERCLIYAMVNTLAQLDGVNAVRFQVEGETVDSLVGEIWLRGELMENPGIVDG